MPRRGGARTRGSRRPALAGDPDARVLVPSSRGPARVGDRFPRVDVGEDSRGIEVVRPGREARSPRSSRSPGPNRRTRATWTRSSRRPRRGRRWKARGASRGPRVVIRSTFPMSPPSRSSADGRTRRRTAAEISRVASRTIARGVRANFDAGVPAAQCATVCGPEIIMGFFSRMPRWRISPTTTRKVDGRILDILSWGDLSAGRG